MTSDQWKALNDALKRRSRWYPFDPCDVPMTMDVFRELMAAYEDGLAVGDYKLRDEPNNEPS